MNSSSVSVMLVDDHAVVRAGYKRFIELDPGLKVIAEASSGEEAYTFLESNPVDVIIMDLSMPGQGGFETLRRLLNRFPQQKILIFTMHENASIAHQAVKLGASGYLTKSMEPDLIVQAIHDVMAGGTPIAKAIAEGLNLAPELKLVLLHGGGSRVIEYSQFSRHSNSILLDLSHTVMKFRTSSILQDIAFLLKDLDQRLCIGSDGPEWSYDQVIPLISELTGVLSPEKRENVLWKNISRLLDLDTQ